MSDTHAKNTAPPEPPVPAPGHAARRFSQEINRVINAFSQELAPHELVGLLQLQQDSLTTHILNIVRVAEAESTVVPEDSGDGFGTPVVPQDDGSIPRLQPET